MNKKQKTQLGLAGCFVVLLILWLFEPGWRVSKILGIIANALLLLSMLLSYRAEEKMKGKDDNKKKELRPHWISAPFHKFCSPVPSTNNNSPGKSRWPLRYSAQISLDLGVHVRYSLAHKRHPKGSIIYHNSLHKKS